MVSPNSIPWNILGYAALSCEDKDIRKLESESKTRVWVENYRLSRKLEIESKTRDWVENSRLSRKLEIESNTRDWVEN